MFTTTLYTNFSKPMNSTKRPSGGTSFPCEMVESCGVLNPRITFNQGAAWNPSAYNYAQIPDFGRYYWITEWIFEGGIWAAQMSVDALASWKTDILDNSEYVLRSASQYDVNAVDNLYPATVQVSKETDNFFPWPATSLDSGAYVVGVAGNNETTVGGIAYYVASADNLNSLMQKMMSDTSWIGQVGEISDELLKCLVNPMQYITSVMWLPFTPWTTGSSSRVNAGWWFTGMGLPDCGANAPFIGGSVGSRKAHPQSGRGNYLSYSPYTEMILEFPPFGKVSLDPFKYPVGIDIRYSIATDAISGMSSLHIYTQKIGDGDSFQCKVGVDLSVGQATSSMLGAAGSAISAIPKGGTPTMYGSAGFDHGAKNSYSLLGNALSALNPELNVVGQNGGTALYGQPAALTHIFHYVVDEDNTHNGKPLCKQKTLSSLSGFTQVYEPEADIPCTAPEKEQIVNYMSGGFYIE